MGERIVIGVVILGACLLLALKFRKTLRGESCSGCGDCPCCSGKGCCEAGRQNQDDQEKEN